MFALFPEQVGLFYSSCSNDNTLKTHENLTQMSAVSLLTWLSECYFKSTLKKKFALYGMNNVRHMIHYDKKKKQENLKRVE